MRGWLDNVADGGGGAAGALLRPLLGAMAAGYGVIIAARNARYDQPRAALRVDGPVVSIGNLTTGGTGKTPMTIHVVERLRAMGWQPAVVSRGYASGGGLGDELRLVREAVPGTPCIANPDRVAGARSALAEHGADVVVLDDAFQHRRIARDLDLVLVDATAPFGGGRLLPRGRLREPIASLARADAVILTRADQLDADRLAEARAAVAAHAGDKPILVCVHRAQAPRALNTERPSPGAAASTKYFLMSGIARPDAFEQTARACGLRVVGHARFADHRRYTSRDVTSVCSQVSAAGGERLLVTEKDAVKLAEIPGTWPMPVDVLPVRIDFRNADATMLDELLAAVLAMWKRPAPVAAAMKR